MKAAVGTTNQSSWRWFPLGLILTMLFVFAVNGWFVYLALQSFPGEAGSDGFDLSNNYDRVLKVEAEQAALGWHVDLAIDGERRSVLRLADRDGVPLPNPVIEARAERPVGPDQTPLVFHPLDAGHYRADTTLFSGQWNVLLTIRAAGHVYSTTQRVIVK